MADCLWPGLPVRDGARKLPFSTSGCAPDGAAVGRAFELDQEDLLERRGGRAWRGSDAPVAFEHDEPGLSTAVMSPMFVPSGSSGSTHRRPVQRSFPRSNSSMRRALSGSPATWPSSSVQSRVRLLLIAMPSKPPELDGLAVASTPWPTGPWTLRSTAEGGP